MHDRLIKKFDDYYVIKPLDSSFVIPLGCELCQFLYRSHDDELSHEEFGCCHKCALKWAHPDRERWKNGYRPSSDEIILEVNLRPQMLFTLE